MGYTRAVKLSDFIKRYNNSKVTYDKRFQRRDSNWSHDKKRSYIKSIARGETLGSICVSNVRESLHYFQDTTDKNSIDYFQGLLNEGIEYVSIDGQHRTKAILEFFEGKFSFSGLIFDTQSREWVTLENTFWSEIKEKYPAAAAQLEDAEINVEEVSRISLQRLPEVFKSLNDGTPLSDQQKRQASHREIAEYFKVLATSRLTLLAYNDTTVEELLVKVQTFNQKKASQAAVDEFFVKLAMNMIRSIRDKSGSRVPNPYRKANFGKRELDEFYLLGKEGHISFSETDSPYIQEEMDRFTTIVADYFIPLLQSCQACNLEKRRPSNRAFSWALAHLSEWLYDNGYAIHNPREFFEYVKEFEKSLVDDSKSEYWAAAQRDRSVKETDYYFRWINLPHQGVARTARKNELISKFKDKLVITTVPGIKLKQPDYADFVTEQIQKSQNPANLIA